MNRFVELATTTPTRPFIEDRFSVKFIETKRLPDAISYSGSPEPASSPSPLQFQAITLHQFTTGGTVTIETRRLDRQWAGSASECVRIGHLMLALGAAWTVKRRPAHPDYSYVATIGGKERELWIEPDFPAAVGDCIQSFSVRYHIVAALEAFPALQSQTLNHGSVSTTDPFDLCVRGIN